LASGVLCRPIVVGLASRIRPDDVPNDYGEDPLAIAARHRLGLARRRDILLGVLNG
jgi:hypothetical protein